MHIFIEKFCRIHLYSQLAKQINLNSFLLGNKSILDSRSEDNASHCTLYFDAKYSKACRNCVRQNGTHLAMKMKMKKKKKWYHQWNNVHLSLLGTIVSFVMELLAFCCNNKKHSSDSGQLINWIHFGTVSTMNYFNRFRYGWCLHSRQCF